MGAFDALEKNYLRELIFRVYLDPTKPEVIQEMYTFSFSYNEGIITMGLGKDSTKEKKEVKMEELKGETQALLRQISVVIQGLEKLPEEAYLAIQLTYYDEVTPVDYEPEGFRPHHAKEVPMPAGSYRVSLGKVNTGFHAMRLQMASRQPGGDTFVNDSYAVETQSQSQSQQMSEETPAPVEAGGEVSQSQEFGDQPTQVMEDQQIQPDTQQMSEEAVSLSQLDSPDSPASTVSLAVKVESTSSSPAAVVSCICQNSSLDPLMLICSTCSTSQHAACYRVLSEEKVPAQHTCWTCSQENPGLACTDPRMGRFKEKGKEHLVAATCLFRRVLVLLRRSQVDDVTIDTIQSTLVLEDQELSGLKKTLLAQQVVTEQSGVLSINQEALQEAIKVFIGIKSKSTTTSSSQKKAVTSKRKKEEMTAPTGEKAGQRKKKKSITGSDLQF